MSKFKPNLTLVVGLTLTISLLWATLSPSGEIPPIAWVFNAILMVIWLRLANQKAANLPLPNTARQLLGDSHQGLKSIN